MLTILWPLSFHFAVVLLQEAAVCAVELFFVLSEARHSPENHIAEEMSGVFRQYRIRQGPRLVGKSGVDFEQRGMVPRIRVEGVELGVGTKRHRHKARHSGLIAGLRGLHDAVVESVESLTRTHVADIGWSFAALGGWLCSSFDL